MISSVSSLWGTTSVEVLHWSEGLKLLSQQEKEVLNLSGVFHSCIQGFLSTGVKEVIETVLVAGYCSIFRSLNICLVKFNIWIHGLIICFVIDMPLLLIQDIHRNINIKHDFQFEIVLPNDFRSVMNVFLILFRLTQLWPFFKEM